MQASGVDPATAEVLRACIHELKGPANRLRLLSQVLGRSSDALDNDARTLLGHIEESAASVGSVAEGLKTYFEICTRALRRQPLDLNLPLDSAIAGLAAQMTSTGTQVTRGALPVVNADGFIMSWVFQELLSNALHHRGEELRIHVCSMPDGFGRTCVCVSDNGPGIGREMAERIFRPFEKLAPGPGAGLGLTICRKTIEMHGGRMWAEERAEGAEFRFFVDGASKPYSTGGLHL